MAGKALASAADSVLLDLEDAVAPDEKAGARKQVVHALKELDWRTRPTLYRANALDTPHFYRDVIEVVEEAGGGLDSVLIPKVQRPEDLHVAAALLSQIELAIGLEPGKVKIEAQIESAEGLVNVDAIARATERLEALHFGPGDFAASLRMPYRSIGVRSEEHTSELQSRQYLVCRLLLEKKKKLYYKQHIIIISPVSHLLSRFS